MATWFGDHQLSTTYQAGMNLAQKPAGVGSLISRPEGEHEVNWIIDANGITPACMCAKSACHTCSLGPFAEGPEHLRLQVYRNHAPVHPNHLRHGNGEKPHSAAKIHYCQARL